MRARILIPVLVLGAVALAGLLLLQPRGDSEQPPSTALAMDDTAPGPATNAPQVAERAARQTAPDLQTNALEPFVDSSETRHEAYVAARVAELEDLAADNAPASLEIILSELTNRDPEIRKAAREAAVEFGSREAIPRLLDAAAQTDDAREKVALQEAVDFLKLPTPAELATPSTADPNIPSPPHAAAPQPAGAVPARH